MTDTYNNFMSQPRNMSRSKNTEKVTLEVILLNFRKYTVKQVDLNDQMRIGLKRVQSISFH